MSGATYAWTGPTSFTSAAPESDDAQRDHRDDRHLQRDGDGERLHSAAGTTAATVNAAPTTATVGGPQTICASGTTTGLGGNTPTTGSGSWSVVSGGTGNFSGATTPNATFTHTGGAGPVVLRWTIANAPCTASTADVTITINCPPVANPDTFNRTPGMSLKIPVADRCWRTTRTNRSRTLSA